MQVLNLSFQFDFLDQTRPLQMITHHQIFWSTSPIFMIGIYLFPFWKKWCNTGMTRCLGTSFVTALCGVSLCCRSAKKTIFVNVPTNRITHKAAITAGNQCLLLFDSCLLFYFVLWAHQIWPQKIVCAMAYLRVMANLLAMFFKKWTSVLPVFNRITHVFTNNNQNLIFCFISRVIIPKL